MLVIKLFYTLFIYFFLQLIAKGKSASELFPAVVKNVASKNIEVWHNWGIIRTTHCYDSFHSHATQHVASQSMTPKGGTYRTIVRSTDNLFLTLDCMHVLEHLKLVFLQKAKQGNRKWSQQIKIILLNRLGLCSGNKYLIHLFTGKKMHLFVRCITFLASSESYTDFCVLDYKVWKNSSIIMQS